MNKNSLSDCKIKGKKCILKIKRDLTSLKKEIFV